MKKLLLSTILFIVGFISVSAQQTAYEKKVEEICTKYYCYGKYGYNGGLTMEDIMTLSIFGEEAAARLSLVNYALTYDAQRGEKWIESFERELENAKSLMTDADFQKIFLKTSYGRAMTKVKEAFDGTFIKDEFETQAQFEVRVKNDAAQKFDKLCSKLLTHMNLTLQIKITPKSYDAEKEMYKVEIEEIFELSENSEIKNNRETWLKMNPDAARQYKGETIQPQSILSVIWVNDDNDICTQEVKYIDDTGKEKIYNSQVKGKPLVFEYDKYKESKPLLPGHVWKASDLKNYYETYVRKLKTTIDEYNKKIIEDKYYDSVTSSVYLLQINNYHLSKDESYDPDALQNELDRLKMTIKNDYKNALKKVLKGCRENTPDRFIAIYASENIDFSEKVAKLELDYRCYNYDYNELAFYVIDNKEPRVTKCYDKYKELFNNKEEFNSFYTNVSLFNKEVKSREVLQKKYLTVIRDVSCAGPLVFKGAKDVKKDNIASYYINSIEELKIIDSWYNSTLDEYFKADTKMAKEYEKIGYLFNSKKEFFEAYISADYKKILKMKKNAKK